MIKTLIGKITQPKDLFVSSSGDYWVSTFYFPAFNDRWEMQKDYSGFSYQKVKQNRIGAWGAESQWMKTSYELQRASL